MAQGLELVNDHHQPCRWIGHTGSVLNPRSGDQALAALQFPLKAVQRAYGPVQIQIGHAAHGVRQSGQQAKAGTTLEIQQDQIEPVWRLTGGQGQTPGLQKD